MYIIKIFDERGKQINEFEMEDFALIRQDGKGITSNGQDIMSFLGAAAMGMDGEPQEEYQKEHTDKVDKQKEAQRKAKIIVLRKNIAKLGKDENGLPNH